MKATFFMLGQYNPCIKDAHDFNKANCTRYAPHFTLLCGASKGFMKALKTFGPTTKKFGNKNLT